MKFANRLKVPIMMEENKLMKIQETLYQLLEVKKDIEKKIQEEEEKINHFQTQIMKKGEASSPFFADYYDRLYVLKKEKELADVLLMIKEKNKEYQAVKNKIEKMNEVSQLREKEHYEIIERKEEKEVEDLRGMMRNLSERGD